MVTYNARFHSLDYEESVYGIKRGVKGHSIPRYAISGGNGSFRCAIPAKLTLTLKTPSGAPYTSPNIIQSVRKANGWERITTKRIAMLEKKLSGETFVIEDGEIKDLEFLVRV